MAWPPKNNFRKEQPLRSISADWLNTVANFIRFLDVYGGHVERPGQNGKGATIVFDAFELPGAGGGLDFSFRFKPTSSSAGDLTAGTLYLAGATLAISGLPSSISSLSDGDTHYYYIAVDLTASTATWTTNTTGFVDGTYQVENVPIVEIATNANGITSVIQRQLGDIHIPRAA